MMNSKQFFKYLQEPDQLTDSSVVEIEQLINELFRRHILCICNR